jgi:hypothetical protein
MIEQISRVLHPIVGIIMLIAAALSGICFILLVLKLMYDYISDELYIYKRRND